MRLDQPEADVVAQRADVGDMVAEALKLKQQCPEPAGFHRHRGPARLFGGSVCRPCAITAAKMTAVQAKEIPAVQARPRRSRHGPS